MDLRTERETKGWTREQLAEKTGFNKYTIAKWENKHQNIGQGSLKLLEDLFAGKEIKAKPKLPTKPPEEYTLPKRTGPKDFEPELKFEEGKRYKFTAYNVKTLARSAERDKERSIILTFKGVCKGDRWLKHYLFQHSGGSPASFTQLQLRDYQIVSLKTKGA